MGNVGSALAVIVAVSVLRVNAEGENLFPFGDFAQAEKLGVHVFTNGGDVSPHREQYNWNICGCLKITSTTTNNANQVTGSAGAVIGSDGKTFGVPVRGGALYDFSIEVRGKCGRVSLGACAWKTGLWQDGKFLKTTIAGTVPVKDEDWTVYRGSFTVPEGMTRASVYVHLWVQDRVGVSGAGGVGKFVLFDNVRVSEAVEGFAALDCGLRPVPKAKALVSSIPFADFESFTHGSGGTGRSPLDIRAFVEMKTDTLVVDMSVRLPSGCSRGNSTFPWSGDCVETFIGRIDGGLPCEYVQLAWNPAGATFAETDAGRKVLGLKVARNEVLGDVWRSRVILPVASLGLRTWPTRGTAIPLNVCYTGRGNGARQYATWASVRRDFADVAHFGRLYVGTYAEALKKGWNVDEDVKDRETFERRVSEIETEKRKSNLERFKEAGFTVSVLPAESDYEMPFVPRESFHPVTNISVRAAVNERLGVPIAVLNTGNVPESYVVRLETSTFDPQRPWVDKEYNGTWGLKGFPPKRLTVRHALPLKDTESSPTTSRLDPLPKMDEACSIRVAAREAGLVWFDFNTEGVKPGVYRGRLRVIPLTQPSVFKSCGKGYGVGLYEGKMQDIPFELEVLPITLPDHPTTLMGFFQSPADEAQFDLMYALGTREFAVDPWCFGWTVTEKGHYDYGRPGARVAEMEKRVRNIAAWSAKRGFRPRFFFGFGTYGAFSSGKKPDEARRLWPEYVKGIKRCMNAWGVSDEEYCLEVFDEPGEKGMSLAEGGVLAAAKAAVPTVRLSMTLSAELFPVERLRKLDGLVDSWILWSPNNFSGDDRKGFVCDFLKKGGQVWHYTCSESGRNPPYGWYRLHPWYGLRHGLTGSEFFWFQNTYGGPASLDFKERVSSGIVLTSFGSMMPTLRYMAMRNGVTDLKYLDLLRSVAGDRPDVRRFLADAPIAVVERERHDRTAADRMRAVAVKLILKYLNR